MVLSEKRARPLPWFAIAVLLIWLLSLSLRFWGLGRFNTLVFDEVYYVKFAHQYLTGTPFFDGHPPLSKYLIALGMWLGNQWPIGQDAVNVMAGAPYSSWSYRWLNALTGSFIPLVVMGLAYQLTRRPPFSLLAGGFVALDGLFLVESRYALNNIYLVLLGVSGLWFLLLALNSSRALGRSGWLLASGLAFGASAAIKWNGLWFLLGAYGLWIGAWVIHWVSKLPPRTGLDEGSTATDRVDCSPLQRLTRLRVWQMGVYLGAVPALFYTLLWIPHLQINAKTGFWSDFWDLQRQILSYHERVGSGPQVHPYCSSWYSWLLMIRPVAYFYQVTKPGDPLPTGGSIAPEGSAQVIYDVHAIGNPILWWLSAIALLMVILGFAASLLHLWRTGQPVDPLDKTGYLPRNWMEFWLYFFLVINYLANLLPWIRVNRCLFLYHYMGASVFATMALAWLVDRSLTSAQPRFRIAGVVAIVSIILAFIFWLPLYLGLPLSPTEFRLRIWLPSWI